VTDSSLAASIRVSGFQSFFAQGLQTLVVLVLAKTEPLSNSGGSSAVSAVLRKQSWSTLLTIFGS